MSNNSMKINTPTTSIKHEKRIRKLEDLKNKFYNIKPIPEHQEIKKRLEHFSNERSAQRYRTRKRIHQQNMSMFERLINAKPTTAFQEWQD